MPIGHFFSKPIVRTVMTNSTFGDPDKTQNTPNSSTDPNPQDTSGIEASETNVKDKDLNGGLDYMGEPTTVDRDFTYPTHLDPARQADPHGIYLDDVQRREAEIQRAKVENRKPDLKNPPSTVSTPLIPTHVAKTYYPGDYEVPVAVSLPVVVGVAEDSRDNYGDAKALHERERNADTAKKENSKREQQAAGTDGATK